MESFRTDKEDRETFARVLGWTSTTRAIYSNDKTEIFRGINVNMGGDETWQFCNNGYQRTVARLHELKCAIKSNDLIHVIINCKTPRYIWNWNDDDDDYTFYGNSTNTGEALFKAVVAMGEAHNGQ